jgi:hypothetical protein
MLAWTGHACVPDVSAMEREMLYGLEILGGQYYFRGDRGNLTGNVTGFVAPVLLVNENWTILPSWSSRYQGTKQVVDLVGAGSLFQQQMNHRGAVKAVYRRPDSKWAQKGSLGYTLHLLKETADESWFDGLFDYQRIDIGYEAEFHYSAPHSVRFGSDIILTHYPNYTSLESQQALDFNGETLARELIGDNILDSRAFSVYSGLTGRIKDAVFYEADIRFSRTSFGQQHIVSGSGLLNEDSRVDLATDINASVSRPVDVGVDMRFTPSVSLGVSNNVSNQNSYDALRTEFQSGFYNYTEWRVGPGVRADLGDLRQPITVSLSSSLSFRKYPNRKIQSDSGTYGSDTLTQDRWTIDFSASYPIAPRLRLLFQFQYGRSSSNQSFEQFYSYNYTATNYLGGFRFEY